jgi:hypothetical protein
MSQIHKVINLKQSFKIFDQTPVQLILLAGSLVGALIIMNTLPKDCKIVLPGGQSLPGGLFAFIGMIGLGIVLGRMSELKPWIWWKNVFLYRLKLEPVVWLPKPEPAPVYPDPTIIEAKKKVDEYYVEA